MCRRVAANTTGARRAVAVEERRVIQRSTRFNKKTYCILSSKKKQRRARVTVCQEKTQAKIQETPFIRCQNMPPFPLLSPQKQKGLIHLPLGDRWKATDGVKSKSQARKHYLVHYRLFLPKPHPLREFDVLYNFFSLLVKNGWQKKQDNCSSSIVVVRS